MKFLVVKVTPQVSDKSCRARILRVSQACSCYQIQFSLESSTSSSLNSATALSLLEICSFIQSYDWLWLHIQSKKPTQLSPQSLTYPRIITLSITAYVNIMIFLDLMSLLWTLYANRLKEHALKAVLSMHTASRITILVSSIYRWCRTSPSALWSEDFSSPWTPQSLHRASIVTQTISPWCSTKWCQLNSLTNLIRHTSVRTWCCTSQEPRPSQQRLWLGLGSHILKGDGFWVQWSKRAYLPHVHG